MSNIQSTAGTAKAQHPDACVVNAPKPLPGDLNQTRTLFLSGSIDRDTAVDWRLRLTTQVLDLPVTVINPHRSDWDSTWREEPDFPQFREQTQWELSMLAKADIAAIYFAPGTPAAVTLFELGSCLQKGSEGVVVFCPDSYWKRGNVQLICEAYNLVCCKTFEEFVTAVRTKLGA